MNSWADMAGGFQELRQRLQNVGTVPSALTFPLSPRPPLPPGPPLAHLSLPLPLTHLEVLLDDHVVAEEQCVTRTPRVGDLACGGSR